MDTPSAVFPSVYPLGVPRALPEAILRPVVLRNFAKPPKPPNWGKMNVYEQVLWRRANRTRDKGNRAIYEEQARRAGENRGTTRPDENWDPALLLILFGSLGGLPFPMSESVSRDVFLIKLNECRRRRPLLAD